jgi:hypothetical protein
MAIKPSNRVVSVLFTTEQVRGLKIAAAYEDRSMSNIVGRLVLEYLVERGFLTRAQAYPNVLELEAAEEEA